MKTYVMFISLGFLLTSGLSQSAPPFEPSQIQIGQCHKEGDECTYSKPPAMFVANGHCLRNDDGTLACKPG